MTKAVGESAARAEWRLPLSVLAAAWNWLSGLRFAWVAVAAVVAANLAVAVAGFVSLPVPDGWLTTSLDQLAAGRWWTPLTALVIDEPEWMLAVHVPLLLVMLGVAERLLGARRAVVAAAVTAISAVVVGLAVQQAGAQMAELWARSVRSEQTVDVLVPAVGALAAASGRAGALWGRRIRYLLLGVTGALVLFSGDAGDLFMLLAAICGAVLSGRPGWRAAGSVGWTRSSHHERRVLLAGMVATMAVGPLVSSLSRVRVGPFAPLGWLIGGEEPDWGKLSACLDASVVEGCLRQFSLARSLSPGAVVTSIMPVLVLLVAAIGIWRGRRLAAWVAIVINVGFSCFAMYFFGAVPWMYGTWHAHGSLPVWELVLVLTGSAVAPAAVAVTTLVNLRHVQLRASRSTLLRACATIVGTFVLLSALYLIVGLETPGGFTRAVTALDLLEELPERFLPVGFLHLEPATFLPAAPLTGLISSWMGACFWGVCVVAVAKGLEVAPPPAVEEARRRLDALLLRGGGTMSFMTTWDGCNLWFSRDRQAAVAYRVCRGVALTVGEPVGEARSDGAPNPTVALEFARFCDDHGWIPAFYSVHDDWAQTLRSHGWSSIGLGQESVIDPAVWQTKGKRWQDVRTAINRARREGITDVWAAYPDLPFHLQLQIAEVSEQWVADKPLPEMEFMLGGIDQIKDPRVRLLLAVDSDGRLEAVTSWLPFWNDGELEGYTLDFMRRRPDSVNGVMEFLIARMAERQQSDGRIRTLSLSAAPLAGVGEETASAGGAVQTGLIDELLEGVGRTLEPVYGFRSLLAFKRKFQPREQSLFACYPDAASLPSLGVAVLDAYLPGVRIDRLVSALRSVQ